MLTDLGDGRTEMRFEQRGHMSAEQYERAESGWGGFFDRIAKRLSTPDVPARPRWRSGYVGTPVGTSSVETIGGKLAVGSGVAHL